MHARTPYRACRMFKAAYMTCAANSAHRIDIRTGVRSLDGKQIKVLAWGVHSWALMPMSLRR